jgi:hypothetical protein
MEFIGNPPCIIPPYYWAPGHPGSVAVGGGWRKDFGEGPQLSAQRVHGDVGASPYSVINLVLRGDVGMPKRSNEFQRLVAMLTMLKSDGATVLESVEVMEIASQERREVDVVAFGKGRRSSEHRFY